MIKAKVTVSPKVTIEIEAEKQKDLFKAIASAEEVFGESQCGLCQSKDIKFAWRTVTKVNGKKVETFEFPEYRCQNPECRAHLGLGSHNDDKGTLFPQRKLLDSGKSPGKDSQGEAKYGKHNGWTKYRGEVEE